MLVIRWAAIALTTLFILMNLGAAFESEQATWVRIVGATLGVAGIVAAIGFAVGRRWGWVAVAVVGALNCLGAITTLVVGGEGFLPGLVVGGLGLVLGVLARPGARNSIHHTLKA
jgi:hypothetical protein